ncbi:uncharacterized protein LOC115787248 [Archocentrus centrarchus]|uniref:uncharacterized protein LOC115787248 n=1 Tax=Archocentrus centrarchus TaxID=63155 RepID=UPI0011EA12CF|nr:uncharacterized protein LOC115787248 [Archocentrus centrarchus]
MRPRSRLLSKRRLTLPTIREGSEETVRDLNEANTLYNSAHRQAVSSEDYLLSICHLAHPTFPTRDISPDSFHAHQQDAAQQKLRPSRLSETTLSTSECNPKEEACATDVQQVEVKELNGELKFGNSDPLEYLYGHQNNFSALSGSRRRAFVEGRFVRQHSSVWESQVCMQAHGISVASNPDFQQQCKSSCPELNTSTGTSVPNISPKHTLARSEVRTASPADRKAEGERANLTIKQSLISQWISDCRLAWREARARACMLPAIAEV